MNFFKSSFFNDFKIPDVLSLAQEDPDDASQQHDETSGPKTDDASSPDAGAENTPDTKDNSQAASSAWNLGGLVKSIAEKSEGMIQAYRKDLEDFSSGLKKETQIIAEVAVHAVKDLPTSLETGASKAQESIESVGQVIEDFSSSVWRGTADIIAQGKDAVLKLEEESQASGTASSASSSLSRYDNASVPLAGGKYSRFDAQVRAMQHDSSTYCDEPEDVNDYASWRYTFRLPDKKQDIDTLLSENTFLQELFTRFVPDVVEEETFWTRYFYKLHKLKQTEEARENLVKRASAIEEEELGWDTDEEVEEDGMVDDKKPKPTEEIAEDQMSKSADPPVEGSQLTTPEPDVSEIEKEDVIKISSEVSNVDQAKVEKDAKDETERNEEEDDLGWEVAEGVEEDGSKRSSNSEASWDVPEVPKEEIRKRLIATQEQDEEDLTWDDDDDDDTK